MVTNLRSVVTVETVVKPGDKGPNCQESNATIVKLGKQLPDKPVLVAADSVEGEGEAHADNRTSKEGHEHSL